MKFEKNYKYIFNILIILNKFSFTNENLLKL